MMHNQSKSTLAPRNKMYQNKHLMCAHRNLSFKRAFQSQTYWTETTSLNDLVMLLNVLYARIYC